MSDLTTAVLSHGLLIPSGGGGTYPDPADVRFGVVYNTDETGTMYVPTANEVLEGVLVDDTVGNLVLPAIGDVLAGVEFGSNSSLTGTLAASGGSGAAGLTFDFTTPNGTVNNPLAAQQQAPTFANDNTCFWANLERQNRATGLSKVLPAGTVGQSDVAVKGRVLAAQIRWQPYAMRWNGANLIGSLSDAQFFLEVEAGGDTQQGRLTVLIDKLQFSAGAHPKFQDTISISAGGKWHDFTVAEMIGEFDDNEPGLVLYLEKDSNELGN